MHSLGLRNELELVRNWRWNESEERLSQNRPKNVNLRFVCPKETKNGLSQIVPNNNLVQFEGFRVGLGRHIGSRIVNQSAQVRYLG